ncbi:MAG: NADH-quinone oxidoreductase subunit L [Nitrospirae bacterium]|nr:NADH-quinone oxidoreductase subunit L [Nitrospirota bacterium]
MASPITWILLLPLLGALFNGLLGWMLKRRVVETVACASVAGSSVAACIAFAGMGNGTDVVLYDWLSAGGFSAPFTLRLDAISATMAVMVTGVSFIIHLYSVGYMREDEGFARYFALLNLFVAAMLLLVLAGNLPLMFVGWEGVGFCSFGLIGFWYSDPANATAGRKAFIVTRIGDVAFGVALIWLFYLTGTTDIAAINAAAPALPAATATYLGLLLMFGAAGKSAQLPLTVWLPDAMAGPTPVSALIHAATMVTAGVYLLMRMFPVISVSSDALAVITTVGAVTAFYAATSALGQRDIKRVLAYSTISQIGYMVMAVGAGALSAALFHLVVHAFFKALLFMAAGCIIQALHEEHDIFNMGGLMTRMPTVFWCFLAGALALAAAPGTGGFFSKDEVLAATLGHGGALYTALWALGEVTAFVTAFYIFRVVALVFMGGMKKESAGLPARLPGTMVWSLVPLAVLAIAGGIINLPATWGGSGYLSGLLASQGLAPLVEAGHGWAVQAISASVCASGIGAAYYMYLINPALRDRLAARYTDLNDFLSRAWGLDALYYRLFVTPFSRMADVLWHRVDEGAINRALDGIGDGLAWGGSMMRLSVTGRASTYIMATIVGAAAIILYFAVNGGV